MGVSKAQEEGKTKTHSPTNKEIGKDFEKLPRANTKNFFITIDEVNPSSNDNIATLYREVKQPDFITWFLQLPTITTRPSKQKKDPIVDFEKSMILTSLYEEAVVGVINARENAREK